jgi:hypothetical protein
LFLLMCCITFNDLCILNHPVSWDKVDSVMVYDVFDMLLNCVCHYFTEDFCIYFH